MSKILRKQLEEVWVEEKEKLSQMDFEKDKDAYKLQATRVSELEDRLVDLEKYACDIALKVTSQEEEKKNQLIRNGIEVAKVVVPVVGAFVMGMISMKWEKEDTLTSSAGKSALRDILKFK